MACLTPMVLRLIPAVAPGIRGILHNPRILRQMVAARALPHLSAAISPNTARVLQGAYGLCSGPQVLLEGTCAIEEIPRYGGPKREALRIWAPMGLGDIAERAYMLAILPAAVGSRTLIGTDSIRHGLDMMPLWCFRSAHPFKWDSRDLMDLKKYTRAYLDLAILDYSVTRFALVLQ